MNTLVVICLFYSSGSFWANIPEGHKTVLTRSEGQCRSIANAWGTARLPATYPLDISDAYDLKVAERYCGPAPTFPDCFDARRGLEE